MNGVPGHGAVTQPGSKAKSVGHVHGGFGVLQTPAELLRDVQRAILGGLVGNSTVGGGKGKFQSDVK